MYRGFIAPFTWGVPITGRAALVIHHGPVPTCPRSIRSECTGPSAPHREFFIHYITPGRDYVVFSIAEVQR
jgi:hypothetical protein